MLGPVAYNYASEGWAVFPLAPRDKVPMGGTRGVHDATTDLEKVAEWWDKKPDANIGLAMGAPSGVVALDVDDREALQEWIQANGELPATAAIRTSRGGHLLFRPEGYVSNSASKIAEGIDVRGDGGYIVAPPSVHPDGHIYEWANSQPIAPLPQHVAEALQSKPLEPTGHTSTVADPEAQEELYTAIGKMQTTPAGQRNDTLFKLAASIAELAKSGKLDWDDASEHLSVAAETAGLEPSEITRTLDSAYDRASSRDGLSEEWEPKFLSPADLSNLPPMKWLIPHLLPQGFSVLYGAPAAGKTFVALDWSLALAATGKQVVYALGEGLSGLGSRYQAWADAHKTDVGDLLQVLGLGAFPRILEQNSLSDLRRHLAYLPQVDLLVLDTWHRTLGGADEDTSSTVGLALRVVEELQSEFDLSVLVLHHPKKTNAEDGGNGRYSERGSGSLRGAADCMWLAQEFTDTHWRRLVNDKTKDTDELPPQQYMLQPHKNSAIVTPSAVDLLK